jgi:hypothetical protein
MTRARQVFVAYAVGDAELAEKLAGYVEATSSTRMFLHQRDLRADEPLNRAIRDALRRSDAFVLIATPRAFESAWVQHELGAAAGARKPTIVVAAREGMRGMLPALEDVRLVLRDDDTPEHLVAAIDAVTLDDDAPSEASAI